MRWLIQEFLNNDTNISRMILALEKCSADYLLVRINRDNTLTVLETESKLPLDNSDMILQSFIKNEHVMVYGSKTFAKIAQEMNLSPGSFMNQNFEFEVFQKALGNELLNSEFIVGELGDLEPIADMFFIRPTGNTKLFTGMEVTKEAFLSWKEREQTETSPYIGQSLMISPIQKIDAEYRFFVVNQQIVTASSYKVEGSINAFMKPTEDLLIYTKKMVDLFPLAKAFVIDIAETSEGFKVIEYNNINTSGLYGCDEVEFVRAINKLA